MNTLTLTDDELEKLKELVILSQAGHNARWKALNSFLPTHASVSSNQAMVAKHLEDCNMHATLLNKLRKCERKEKFTLGWFR